MERHQSVEHEQSSFGKLFLDDQNFSKFIRTLVLYILVLIARTVVVGVGSMPSALNSPKSVNSWWPVLPANQTFVGDAVEQTSAVCKDTFKKVALLMKSSPAGRQETPQHNITIAMTLCK